jgi:hypothetical protein
MLNIFVVTVHKMNVKRLTTKKGVKIYLRIQKRATGV